MPANPFHVPFIEGAFEIREGLPRPNWEVIYAWSESVPENIPRSVVWTELAAHWLDQLVKTFKSGYAIWESAEFLLLSSREKAESEGVIRFCDRARRSILEFLPQIASDEGYGKHVVLLFSDSGGGWAIQSRAYKTLGFAELLLCRRERSTCMDDSSGSHCTAGGGRDSQ